MADISSQPPADACCDGPWYCQLDLALFREIIATHSSGLGRSWRQIKPCELHSRRRCYALSARWILFNTLAHVQDAQPHQKAQSHFGPYADLEISKEDRRKCRKYEIGNDGKDCGVHGQYATFACYMHKGRLTALRNDDGFDLMIRQTHSVDAHVPVRSERSAHSEEQEDTHGGE